MTAPSQILVFTDWVAPNPDDAGLAESLRTARHSRANLTKQDAYRICAAAEAYVYFAGHPSDTRGIVAQLRTLRRAVRANRKATP